MAAQQAKAAAVAAHWMTDRPCYHPAPLNKLAIVVPVYNEGDALLPWLKEVASYLKKGDQLVIVDASDSSTKNNALKSVIESYDQLHYLRSEKGRAIQMNAGAAFLCQHSIEKHKPDLLWFLHSDTGLSSDQLHYLRALKPTSIWGRFDVRLSPNIFPFAIISAFINTRSRLTQVMTGDQGIFIRTDIFKRIKGYAEIPLMEDVEISKRLRKLAKADCDGPILETSARRWQQYGWLKTVLLMWQLRLLYWLGISPDTLVKKYYGK